MLYGALSGGLELRRARDGTTKLRGRFPYGKTAVLSDGGRTGRPRKERIAPRAFSHRVERPEEDIHLLVGHSYDRPLASRGAKSLDLEDTDEALSFEATISSEMRDVSWVRDSLAGMAAGLTIGLSPGFRLPPERAVEDAETIEEEDDEGPGSENRGAIIRTVNAALLYELSVVTRPAFEEAQVEARSWEPSPRAGIVLPPKRHLKRWRL